MLWQGWCIHECKRIHRPHTHTPHTYTHTGIRPRPHGLPGSVAGRCLDLAGASMQTRSHTYTYNRHPAATPWSPWLCGGTTPPPEQTPAPARLTFWPQVCADGPLKRPACNGCHGGYVSRLHAVVGIDLYNKPTNRWHFPLLHPRPLHAWTFSLGCVHSCTLKAPALHTAAGSFERLTDRTGAEAGHSLHT